MNGLTVMNETMTMSSREIAALTGKPHNDILKAIRAMEPAWQRVTEGKFSLSNYIDSTGRTLPMYKLTKKECLYVATKFNDDARAMLIVRWEELERANQFTIPQTFSEALTLAAKQAEQIEQQQKQLTEAKPKVEFYEAVTGSSDTVDMATVAKVLNMGMGRNKLFELLRNKGILTERNQPYQKYVDYGWFRQIESSYNKPDGSTCINIKTVVYQKGIDGIRKVINNGKAN